MGLRINELPENLSEYLTTPIAAELAFDKDDLKKVMNTLNSEELTKKYVEVGDNENCRDAKFTLSVIPYDDEHAWLYGKLYDLALEGNEQTYMFENIEMFEQIVYMELNEGNYVNFHLDVGSEYPQNTRKITAIVILNESDDYRGGQVNINVGKNIALSRNAGDVFFFPSYLQNEIGIVHSGAKKILVAWFGC